MSYIAYLEFGMEDKEKDNITLNSEFQEDY